MLDGLLRCALSIRDVFIDDALNRAVRDQRFQLRVEGVVDGAVLGKADRVFFVGVGGAEQLQALVARDERGSDLAIDDYSDLINRLNCKREIFVYSSVER